MIIQHIYRVNDLNLAVCIRLILHDNHDINDFLADFIFGEFNGRMGWNRVVESFSVLPETYFTNSDELECGRG